MKNTHWYSKFRPIALVVGFLVSALGASAAPQQQAVYVSSVGVPDNGSYKAGSVLSFVVNFSGNVHYSNDSYDFWGHLVHNKPVLNIQVGKNTRSATVADSANNANFTKLTFSYTVQAGETDTDGIEVTSLSKYTLDSSANNTYIPSSWGYADLPKIPSLSAVLVDTTAPAAATVTVLSSIGAGGTGEAKGSLSLINGASTVIGTATVAANGTWSITFSPVLADGTYNIVTQIADAAGNVTKGTTGYYLLVDTVAPAVPAFTFTSVINKYTPSQVGGTAESNSTVAVFVDGSASAIGFASANASGFWSYTFSPALADGLHSIKAQAADAAGNASALSGAFSVLVDTIVPKQIVFLSFGQSSFSGTAEANSTVRIYDGESLIANIQADASGRWVANFKTALIDGNHQFAGTVSDAAGNTSVSQTYYVPFKAGVAGTPVVAPAPTPAGSIAISASVTTTDTHATINGTAAAGVAVTVFDGNKIVGTAVANSLGIWSLNVTGLNLGSHVFNVTSGSVVAGSVTVTRTPSSRLVNLSVRGNANGSPVILGFVVSTGSVSTAKGNLLLRGVGPTLASFGLTNALTDPTLAVYAADGTLLQSNDNWGTQDDVASVSKAIASSGAFAFAADSKDSALVSKLAPGRYTAVVKPVSTGTGVTLVEAYDISADASDSSNPRLANVSIRSNVGTGNDILVTGFVVSGTKTKTLLVRGVGPTLANYSVTGVLANPVIEVHSADNTIVATNDGWSKATNAAAISTTASTLGAFALNAGSADAALLVTLQPGAYTVTLKGANSTTGVALLEVYDAE